MTDKPVLKLLDTEGLADIPRPRWLIEDFVAEKSTTMIYGPWGLGKSFLALDLVATASNGGEWYGRKIERPLKTLFIVAEGAAWWYRRLLAYEKARGPIDRDRLWWIPQPVDLFDGSSVEFKELEGIVAELRPDVLVIDTWVRCSAAYGMNENDATDVAKAYKNLDYLRDRYDVAPVIVHHPTKSGGFRGSGNQGASVERVISLEAVEGHPTLFAVVDEKGNHTEQFPTFRMAFESVDLSEFVPDDEEFELTSAVVHYEGLAPQRGDSPDSALWAALSPVATNGEEWSRSRLMGLKVIPDGSMSAALKSLVNQGHLEKVSRGTYRVMK